VEKRTVWIGRSELGTKVAECGAKDPTIFTADKGSGRRLLAAEVVEVGALREGCVGNNEDLVLGDNGAVKGAGEGFDMTGGVELLEAGSDGEGAVGAGVEFRQAEARAEVFNAGGLGVVHSELVHAGKDDVLGCVRKTEEGTKAIIIRESEEQRRRKSFRDGPISWPRPPRPLTSTLAPARRRMVSRPYTASCRLCSCSSMAPCRSPS